MEYQHKPGCEQDPRPALELDPDGRAWWRLGGRRWPVAAGGDTGGTGGGAGGNPSGDPGKGGGDAGDKGDPGKGGGDDAGDAGKGGGGDGGDGDDDPTAKARKEAAKYRTELRAAQARVAELENAGKSELERTQAERDAARKEAEGFKGELGNLRVEVAVMKRAGTHGILDPDAAARLLDRSLLEAGDDGAPTVKSMDAALRELVKAKPYLARQGGADGGGGTGGGREGGATAPSDALRQAIAARKGISVGG